jgi:hypothetical protein
MQELKNFKGQESVLFLPCTSFGSLSLKLPSVEESRGKYFVFMLNNRMGQPSDAIRCKKYVRKFEESSFRNRLICCKTWRRFGLKFHDWRYR